MFKQIPNLFTLLNLLFGCIAIAHILSPDTIGGNSLTVGMITGSIYIFLAAVVDFLDGFVARLFKATSGMGAQLDSLADAVTFGVAPGMIIYKFLQIGFASAGQIHPSFWLLLPAFIIPCAAVWRLAKFNLDAEQRYYFKGVPTPAAGLTVASLPLIAYQQSTIDVLLYNPYALYSFALLISILMVCNLPIISLKFKNRSLNANIDKIVLAVIAILSAVFLRWLAVPVVFILYIIVSIILRPNKSL
ncbi:MAG: CDP-alcohol phosphatidyltransferase family protein [Niabella sp.]